MFSSCRATCPSSPGELGLVQVRPGNLDKGCRVTSSLSITPRFQAGPDSTTSWPRAETRTWTRILLQSHLSKFARGTWTRNLDNCGLPCQRLSQYCGKNGLGLCNKALSLEGVSEMDSILPDRLLALVRPGNDLVLRRIRNLKRCVEACGCKIMTPRYAPQFGSRLHFKRCQALPKEIPFPFFWIPFLGPFFFFFFSFFVFS